MKRFLSRHMSLRRHEHYTLLSCSDSHLDRNHRTLKKDAKGDVCAKPDVLNNISQRKRPWYKLSRRKKRRESETTLVREGEGVGLNSKAHENFEIGVEASSGRDEEDTFVGHATLMRSVSTSLLDVRNAGVEVGHYAQVNRSVHECFAQIHATIPSGLKVETLQRRRFAICEELEREIVADDGVNLRKSRKNLVIRQVLHDLLLL